MDAIIPTSSSKLTENAPEQPISANGMALTNSEKLQEPPKDGQKLSVMNANVCDDKLQDYGIIAAMVSIHSDVPEVAVVRMASKPKKQEGTEEENKDGVLAAVASINKEEDMKPVEQVLPKRDSQVPTLESVMPPLKLPRQGSVTSSLLPETSVTSLTSYSSLAAENLATCGLPASPRKIDCGTSPIMFDKLDDNQQLLSSGDDCALSKYPAQVESSSDKSMHSPVPLHLVTDPADPRYKGVILETKEEPDKSVHFPVPLHLVTDPTDPRYKGLILEAKEEPYWYAYTGMKHRPLPPIMMDEQDSIQTASQANSSPSAKPLASRAVVPDLHFRRRMGELPEIHPSNFELSEMKASKPKKVKGKQGCVQPQAQPKLQQWYEQHHPQPLQNCHVNKGCGYVPGYTYAYDYVDGVGLQELHVPSYEEYPHQH